MNKTLKYVGLFAILPLLTVAITTNYVIDAEAIKSKGTSSSQYGSATKLQVCGGVLCSEYPGGYEQFQMDKGESAKIETQAVQPEISMKKPMASGALSAIPTITKAGTIDAATLYDDGATNTWNIVAVSRGDPLDFSEESAKEIGLGAVLGVFNGTHIWVTGQHETAVEGIKYHDNVNDFQAHTHLASLRNTNDCTGGFAYEKVFSTDTDNTSIVYDQNKDTSIIKYSGIPANSDEGDIVDKSLVCHKEDNGKDVGEYYVWEFYKGNNDALCIDVDTARSQDKLISQDAKTGGFVCP